MAYRDIIHPKIAGLGGITAQVVELSLSPCLDSKPLVTLQLCYPRFIHSEFMTHRVFSRNASSSRAIPVAKMLDQVRMNPAMPIHWGKNQPGMQAFEECSELVELKFFEEFENPSDVPLFTLEKRAVVNEAAWRYAAKAAADFAEAMSKAGYHKQVVNRILEPFQFIHVIVTATEWHNFFELRDHPDAQPEIRELASVMKAAIDAARPRMLNLGEWHLPYVTAMERSYYNNDSLLKLSAARCARVSYLNHDGTVPDPGKDFALFDRLVGSTPLHASPIEHQATPDRFDCPDSPAAWANPHLHGNFDGWVQHRKIFEQQFLH